MASEKDIKSKLKQLIESKESIEDTLRVLDTDMPEMIDPMIEEYMKNLDWLKVNGAKVMESNNPNLAQLKESLGIELIFGKHLDNISKQRKANKLNYIEFKNEVLRTMAEARDKTIKDPSAGGGISTPSPQLQGRGGQTPTGPTTSAGPSGGTRPTPPPATNPPGRTTPGAIPIPSDEDDLDAVLKYTLELDEKEKREKDREKEERDRRERDLRDRERRDREDRERRDREDRERREREDRDRRDRERRDREDRERREREDRERRERERKDKEAYDELKRSEGMKHGYSEDDIQIMPDKKPATNLAQSSQRMSPATKPKPDDDFRKGVDKIMNDVNRDRFGRTIGDALPGMLATDDVAHLIGKGADGVIGERMALDALKGGLDGVVAERAAAGLIGNTMGSMINQDNMGKLVGNAMPSMLNQDAFANLIGRATPSMINQNSMAQLIGSGMNSMINQNNFGKLIGSAIPGIMNQDAMGKTIGAAMPNLLNQDNFAKLLGSAVGGLTNPENEAALANKQKAELEGEIKKKEQTLKMVRDLVNEEELKEHQLRDKLNGLRTLAADIRAETDKIRQQADIKKEENDTIHNEIKHIKREMHDVQKELDELKKSEETRTNAHKELRKERQAHRQELQNLESQIQTYKSGYNALMRRWNEEVNGAPTSLDNEVHPELLRNNFIGKPPSPTVDVPFHSTLLGIRPKPTFEPAVSHLHPPPLPPHPHVYTSELHRPNPSTLPYVPTNHNSFVAPDLDRYSVSTSSMPRFDPNAVTRQPLEPREFGGSSYAQRYLSQFK